MSAGLPREQQYQPCCSLAIALVILLAHSSFIRQSLLNIQWVLIHVPYEPESFTDRCIDGNKSSDVRICFRNILSFLSLVLLYLWEPSPKCEVWSSIGDLGDWNRSDWREPSPLRSTNYVLPLHHVVSNPGSVDDDRAESFKFKVSDCVEAGFDWRQAFNLKST